MKAIAGVPESITRADYLALVAGVGFETKDLRSLEFRVDGIYAEVYERGDKGLVLDGHGDSDEVVVNRVYIPVKG